MDFMSNLLVEHDGSTMLIYKIEAGATLVIGQPRARIMPFKPPRPLGGAAGMITMAADFDAPLDELFDVFD